MERLREFECMDDLVNILSQHFSTDTWLSFFDSLNSRIVEEYGLQANQNVREVILSTLNNWIFTFQEQATIAELISRLQSSGFTLAADDIRTRYRNGLHPLLLNTAQCNNHGLLHNVAQDDEEGLLPVLNTIQNDDESILSVLNMELSDEQALVPNMIQSDGPCPSLHRVRTMMFGGRDAKYKIALFFSTMLIVIAIMLITPPYETTNYLNSVPRTPKPTSSQLAGDNPAWYEMQRPNLNFGSHEEELNKMLSIYNNYVESGNLTSIFVTGPVAIGKSELARSFAHKLYVTNRTNCVWINGTDLKAEFQKFNNSESGANLWKDLMTTNDNTSRWLITFDEVNTEKSIKELDELFYIFNPKNLTNSPMLVITSTDKMIRSKTWAGRYSRLHIKLPYVENLSNIFNTAVMPYIIDRVGEDVQKIQILCNGVDIVFIKLDSLTESQDSKLKSAFSLMALQSYFLAGSMESRYFKMIWGLLVNETEQTLLLENVFYSFLNTSVIEIVYENITKIQNTGSGFASFFRDYYFKHPWVNEQFLKFFQFSPIDIGIYRWIMKATVKFLTAHTFDDFGADDIEQFSNFLGQILNHDILVTEYRLEILLFQKYMNIDILSLAFHRYLKLFSGRDPQTLNLGESLAEAYVRKQMYRESAEMYKHLYRFKKKAIGRVHNKTFEAGDKAIYSYKKQHMLNEAYAIAQEMLENCKILKCNIQIMEKRQRVLTQIYKTD